MTDHTKQAAELEHAALTMGELTAALTSARFAAESHLNTVNAQRTIIASQSGEITALTEANKLLAAQVAASEVKQSWIIHDPQGVIARLRAAAMSLHDAVNKHVASDDRTSLGVAFEEMDNAMAEAVGLEYSVVGAKAEQVAGPVEASMGDDEQFLFLLNGVIGAGLESHACGGDFGSGDKMHAAEEKLIAYIDSRAAKVSARAADAPSEPSDDYKLIAHLIGVIFMAGDFVAETANERQLEQLLIKTGHRYKDWAEVDALNEAAADALDSQPTVPAACGACHGSGRMVRDADIGTDQECFSCDGSGVSDEASSQPADGEVRNEPL